MNITSFNTVRTVCIIAIATAINACGGSQEDSGAEPGMAPESQAVAPREKERLAAQLKLQDQSFEGYAHTGATNEPYKPVHFKADSALSHVRAVADFDGNGTADVLWQAANGNMTVSMMSGTAVLSCGALGLQPEVAIGTGDFNGDGKADIVWRNMGSGAVRVSLMNGGVVTQWLSVGQSPIALNTKLEGIGDFDGNGRADMLWRNQTTGRSVMSYHNADGSVASWPEVSKFIDPVRTTALKVGDLNGDGLDDIVWRNMQSGNVVISIMNGNSAAWKSITQSPISPTVALEAIGDFDGNGKADLLWRNTATGRSLMSYHTDSGLVESWPVVSNFINPSTTSAVGVGDFGGDGKADILWRNLSTGNTVLSAMLGNTPNWVGSSFSSCPVQAIAEPSTGRFVDAPVYGLGYRTESQMGYTNPNGEFRYLPGESIEFFIGRQTLGATHARSLLTPYEVVVPGATQPSDLQAVRLAQVLQSLDSDHNHSNGIELKKDAHDLFNAQVIDFTSNTSSFNNSFAGSLMNTNYNVVEFEAAQAEFEQSMAAIEAEYNANCAVPVGSYQLRSVGAPALMIDVNSNGFDCYERSRLAYFSEVFQKQTLAADFSLLSEKNTQLNDLAGQETEFIEYARKKSALGQTVEVVSVVVDGMDDFMTLTSKEAASNRIGAILKVAIDIVDRTVKYEKGSASVDYQEMHKRTQFAQAVVGVVGSSVSCAKGKRRSNACTQAVFDAMKLIEPSIAFNVSADDENAQSALESIGSSIDAIESLVKAGTNPVKAKAAIKLWVIDHIRIIGTLAIKAKVSDANGVRTFLTESIDAIAGASKGYAACLTWTTSAKQCKDAVLESTLDNLATIVFRGGVILRASALLDEYDAVYISDLVLLEYSANKGDMMAVYRKYNLPIATQISCNVFSISSCSPEEIVNERLMFKRLGDVLARQHCPTCTLASSGDLERPTGETAWRRFNTHRDVLDDGAWSYGELDSSLRLVVTPVNAAKQAQVSVTTHARYATFQCIAPGSIGGEFGAPGGTTSNLTVSYANGGTYQISCSGLTGVGPEVVRTVHFILSQCNAGQVFRLGACMNQASVVAGRLPHTGITASQCYAAGSNTLVSCSSAEAVALSGAGKQDGMYANVNPMSYSVVPHVSGIAGLNYSRNECVRDNVTGLIWEGKMADNSFRDYRRTYTNYGDGRTGDASIYVAEVNAAWLCGKNDWRLPTVDELETLVDAGKAAGPLINADWFINSDTVYWSSSPFVGYADFAWFVDFYDGGVNHHFRHLSYAVRLVRASQ